jgi:hypothetical protein
MCMSVYVFGKILHTGEGQCICKMNLLFFSFSFSSYLLQKNVNNSFIGKWLIKTLEQQFHDFHSSRKF